MHNLTIKIGHVCLKMHKLLILPILNNYIQTNTQKFFCREADIFFFLKYSSKAPEPPALLLFNSSIAQIF